jgi:hypothetical protein
MKTKNNIYPKPQNPKTPKPLATSNDHRKYYIKYKLS